MAASKFSIRHQLLILGALATASIWTGALLQYLQLRSQSHELDTVRRGVASAGRYNEAARVAGEERGLTNGWLLQAAQKSPAELTEVRTRLDARLADLSRATAAAPMPRVPLPVATRLEELQRLRGLIDRHDLPPAESFAYYSSLVAAIQDVAAQRLAAAMIAVGLPYEHANHLQRLAELLAQLRGQTNGALRAGTLTPATETALARLLVLYDDTQRLYQRSVPDSARTRLAPAFNSAAINSAIDGARRIVAVHRLDVLNLDATAWWTLATEGVNTLQEASRGESTVVAAQADALTAAIEQRLRWTVAALVVLGVVTLAMVLSTVGRIVRGLDRLLEGLDAVGTRRNFSARIDVAGHDEFGTISGSINKLIAIAGHVVEEQETLSQTDALTGAVNRRGFDQQIAARTTSARAHAVPLCAVMIDIDHFKSVNDQLGHPAGDQVLKSLVQALRGALRPDDVLARYGGEEFVVLLNGCPLEQALRVADNLRLAVERHDHGIGRKVTASFGVAAWHRGQTPIALMANADAQLYAAKAAGRNRVMPALRAAA